uniref:Membrane protein involved in aromatic hydrocarbon degradation n=1 Tax=Thermodesulfobacterium geofontis TaxID=1295609 RepID=A0A7V6CDC5_9BACT
MFLNILLTILFFLSCLVVKAYGAGIAIYEQGVSGLGNAYAGAAASAEDGSTIFYNPAGLTKLVKPEVSLGSHVIIPNAHFKNTGSIGYNPITGLTYPLAGNNGGDAGVTAVVPNFYVSTPLNERLVLGLGINSPFGLQTEYDKNWVGRYHAIKSKLITINLNPTIAYKVTPKFSLGLGINFQWAEAELTNALNPIAFVRFGDITTQDGFAKLKGDDWSFNWNAGLLYELSEKTRFGLSYRAKLTHVFRGEVNFSNIPSNSTNVFKKDDAKARLNLPPMLSFSGLHKINKKWTILADVTWTGWSRFEELRIKYNTLIIGDTVITTKWEDAFRYSLGLTYQPNSKWTFRTGIAYDETPISSDKYRTPRIPDTDRFWIALGLGYNFSENAKFDLGYVHIFFKKSHIDKDPVGEDLLRGGLKGYYRGHVDIISVQLRYNF